jgi:HK97 family phage prohead protease
MRRAYSMFEVKSFDENKFEVEGIATTPTPDRMGDIVESKGAVYKLPIPLLWQHNSSQPVGEVFAAKATADGIPVRARIFKAEGFTSTAIRERLLEAWESVKSGLVKGFSIGFNPLESEQIEKSWSYRFLSWEWLELSLVTIPANSEATIQTVKSIDRDLLAASGRRPVVKLDEIQLRRARRETRPGVVFLK